MYGKYLTESCVENANCEYLFDRCEKYLRKKEGRVLERTRQSMKRKISNDL